MSKQWNTVIKKKTKKLINESHDTNCTMSILGFKNEFRTVYVV